MEGVILNQAGVIEAPIGRDKQDRKKMAVTDTGKRRSRISTSSPDFKTIPVSNVVWKREGPIRSESI